MRPPAIAYALLLLACAARTPPAAPPPSPLRLEPIWTRLADPAGVVDQDADTASAESAEFSPNGALIAAGAKGVAGPDGRRGQRVIVWRVRDGAVVWERPRANEVEAVAFSRDGRQVAAGGEDRVVEILQSADGRLVATLPTSASIDGLRFSRDGRLLAVGTEAQLILVYRASDWKLLASVHHGGSGANAVNQLDFTADDRLLATAGTNGEVKLWDVERAGDGGAITGVTLRLRHTLPHGATVKAVRFSPDGRFVASGAGKGTGTLIHDVATGRPVAHIPATARTQECLTFTPDGRYLVTGGSEGTARIEPELAARFPPTGGFGYMRFYRVPARAGDPWTLAHAERTFRQEYYDFTPDGRLLVSSHEDGTVRLWRVTSR